MNSPWPTSNVAMNAVLVYGGLFFGVPFAAVGLFWVVSQTGLVTAVLIGLAIVLVILSVCGLYLRRHGKRTAGSA